MKQMNCFYATWSLVLVAILFTSFSSFAQVREPLQPKQEKTALAHQSNIVSPFEIIAQKSDLNPIVKEATYLKLNPNNLKSAMKGQPREILFKIPTQNGTIELLLERQEILSEDFSVTNEKGEVQPYNPGQYYRGIVLDRDHPSVAALGMVGDEIMAMMDIDGQNFVLGALSDGKGKKTSEYVFYNDGNLQIPNTFECGTSVDKHQLDNPFTKSGNKAAAAKNIVRVQLEADYQTFLDKGSVANVTDYVTGLFNMVATIYHKESIVTQISKIVVWTVADPYGISSAVGSGAVLNKFRDRKNLTGINGDLAHLLSTKNVGHGGIAWIDVLCYGNIGYRTAYSNISNSYNNFPLYSWTVDVVTHEMGHNLGSPHTHDCSWGPANNQALDNCYTPSGGCPAGPAPTNGGTIMSYCHLTAAGKNFNLGFGAQPGNLIRSRVAAAACLQKAFLDCATATPIYCGVPVTGSTIGQPNNVTYYGCNSWKESGGERVFVLQTTETTNITASLSNLSADLDVIILDACSESNCLAEGNSSATVTNASPGMYFIVVDGYNGAAGTFKLTVSCGGVCYATGLTNFEFINQVEMGTINNLSGNNYGFADFTGIKTPVQRGGSVDFTLTPGFISSAWSERWRIWIDFNNDNDFNDYGELVYSSPTGSTTAVSGTLNIPAWATLGDKRMRVAMRFGALPDACGTFSGEVEDYTVTLVPYCPSLGNTKYEYIDKIVVGSYGNSSGNNGGYADFTSTVALEAIKGQTLDVVLAPGFSAGAYNEAWAIWIDTNQDFDFDDEGEQVFVSVSPSSGAQTGTITIPESALTGETRMRISMRFAGTPLSCSYSFYGETEDYKINITPFCASAGNTNFEFIQKIGIGDFVNDSGNDGGYADFTDLAAVVAIGEPTGFLLVPGFTGETSYNEYWRIWVDMDGDKKFTTEEQVFEGGPSNDVVFGAFVLPEGVSEGKYALRISMRYGNFPEPCGNFSYGEVEDYTLKVISGGDAMPGNLSDRSSNGQNSPVANVNKGDFQVFPNPATDVLNLQFGNLNVTAGQLVSMTGKVLQSFDNQNLPTSVNVTDLPAGMYMFQVVTMENEVITKRFVKVK